MEKNVQNQPNEEAFVPNEYRLFLGISLNPSVLSFIKTFQERNAHLSNIKWIPEKNLHITVFFFGNIQVEALPNLNSFIQLTLKETPAFTLNFEKFTLAPSAKSPRMIWLRLHKNEAFRLLVQSIQKHFSKINPNLQQRKSPIPHITLARVKSNTSSSFPGKKIVSSIVPEKIEVNALRLWKSDLNPKGAVYTEIQRFELRN